MNRAMPAVALALLMGWSGTFVRGADGQITASLLIAWMLSRRAAPWALTAGWLLGFSALAAGAGPSATLGIMGAAVLALILLGVRRPQSGLDWGVLSGAMVVIAMASFGAVLRLTSRPQLPMTMAVAWLLAVRLGRDVRSARFLRWGLAPAMPLALVMVVLAAAGRDISAREGTMPRSATGYAQDRSFSRVEDLREALRIDPWVSGTWAALGWRELDAGNREGAHAAFGKGYLVRPARENPCARGRELTSMSLGLWRDLAGLQASGHCLLTGLPIEAVRPVAVELWRRGHAAQARQLLRQQTRVSPEVRELAGWLADEAGEDSLAVELLAPGASAGLSGETMYRLARAEKPSAGQAAAHALILRGAREFPRHMELGLASGSPPPVPGRRIGDGVVLGNTVWLLSWDCAPDPASAGDTLTISTAWAPTKPLPGMHVILHLDLDAPPRWRKVADFWPEGRRDATAHWPVGEVAVATTRVAMPADAPPGRYTVYTGMWIPGDRESRLLPGPADAHRVPRGELRFPLGEIVITGPDQAR